MRLLVVDDAPDIATLLLLAFHVVEDRVQGYAAGADAYLVKPFLAEEVQAVVQALLRRSGGAVSVGEGGT